MNQVTPDGKGSSIDKMGLFFLFHAKTQRRKDIKTKNFCDLSGLARDPQLLPRRSRGSADPGKP
jgi:hypothetical protein